MTASSMRNAQRFIAFVILAFGMAGFASSPAFSQATFLTPVSGSGQSTTVDTLFPNALKVIVQDASNNTMPNTPVTFTAPSGSVATTATAIFNGAGNTITVNTDATGTATVPAALVKASQKAAQFNVAVMSGAASTTILLINTPGAAASILVSQGAGQQGTVSTTLPVSFVALVIDTFGNAAPGVGVTFTAPSSGASGTFSGSLTSLTTTNASGLATSASFAFNTTAGVFNVVANTTASALTTPANFNLVSIPGSPTQISVNQGNGQSTVILTDFASTLRAIVRDASNNPVPNVDVTFTVPSSGASATFAGGLTTITAATNASGIATATTLTANATAGSFNVVATFTGGPSINFAMTNTPGAAASLAINAGDNQTATITLDFATSLSVIIKDAGGNVVPGAVVTFSAPGLGASGLFGASVSTTATSNVSGIATATTFTANSIAGTYSITVTYLTFTQTFTLTNINPWAIAVNAGGGQSATITRAFGTAMSARVTNAGGVGIAGLTVTFTAPSSGASGLFVASLTRTAVTNASGIATASTFTANATAGSYDVNATVTGVATPAAFTLTNDNPAAIAVQAGDGQQATIGTAYATLMSAKVTDAGGVGIAGLTVTFTAPGSGASGNFGGPLTKTAVTNASGIATANAFTANATVGAFTVNATVTGLASAAAFNLTNLTPTPATVTASPVNGTPQFVSINAVFGTALGVVVRDVNGVVLNNIPVTFTVNGSGGAGATFAGGLTTWTGNTNASGIVTAAALTANGTAGTYTVTATAGSITFTFTLTNRAADSIAATGGTPQITLIGTNFGAQLAATVVDASGNPVSGATVTFTVPASGASATLSSATATTNASGVASVTATANATIGTYTVTAAVAGVVTPANFNLTNNAPASIAATSGATQTAVINTNFGVRLQATVLDASNGPVAGATVTFTAPSSGASGLFGASVTTTAVTNASGVATAANFRANATAGTYTVNATVAGVAIPAAFTLTNTLATPASAVASPSNGTPQSTAINTAFATALGLLVRDSGGAVIANLPVTFTVNSVGGAGGSFVSGATVTVNTNGSGIATASAFTANGVAGTYTVTATVGTLTVTFTLSNTAVPATIAAFAGNNQSATISTSFANALQARVLDSSGIPVVGAVVVFTAPTTGARANFAGNSTATATTNASGVATAPSATAGTVTGSYTISATVQGTAISTTFTLTNTPGAAATITRVSGNSQSVALGADFAQPLVAVVKDASGNIIPGASVTFNAPVTAAKVTFAGGLTSVTVVTDSSGNATSTVATATGATGSVTVSARVNNTTPSVNFTLTNTGAVPGSVSAQSGSAQTTVVNTNFTTTLQARVLNTLGNPSSGVTVTFTVPSSGASGTFGASTSATATTDASGIATSPVLKANTTSGTFFAQASVTGVASPAIYTLTNTPDSPVAISIVQGTPQTTFAGTAFTTALVAQVKDVYGNPVPGAAVTFLAPTVGSIASFPGAVNSALATTDATGKATAPTLTANSIAGTYTVTASIQSGTSVNYNLTNTPAPVSISAAGSSTQSTPVTTAFGTALQVTVKDASNLPVPGVTVTFAVPASGASAALSAATAVTNALGVASITVTANGTAGTYAVTAAVAGIAAPFSFNLTNTVGAPASLAATGGSTQSTLVTTAFGTALQVTVTDGSNNPVSGVTVTFTAPASGAGATLSSPTATTNAAGVASVTATANGSTGTYAVTAAVAGITTPASFNLTNTVGAPASLAATGGSTQSTLVTTAFGTALQVTVTDGSNNPVSGVTVTFTAPA
ncbi:MAG: Ig-like domain-containing protein, partial [Hyphomicrobiaceae bacterium]